MHNVCIGVMKGLIEFWVKGKKDARLPDIKKDKINHEIKMLRPYLPSEFCRLPRPLDDIEYFKATEIRNFLLYYGPIILKANLNKTFYAHFLLLVVASRILACPETCQKYNNKASQLIQQFIKSYGTLYGQHFIDYNVHSLIHPMFVLFHGPLDNFSCFRYEHYLQKIKSLKSAKYPLQDAYNRILEKQKVNTKQLNHISHKPVLIKQIDYTTHSPLFCFSDKLYSKLILPFSNLTVNVFKVKDKYLMLENNDIVSVNHVIESSDNIVSLVVTKFVDCTEFIPVPNLSFSETGVYNVNITQMSDEYCISIDVIKYKCFFIQLSDSLAVVMSLCHQIVL